MHRFGNIGRAEIDHDFFRRRARRDPQPFITQQLRDFFLNRFTFECEVDESGTGDVWWSGNFRNIKPIDNGVRYLTRIFTPLFGQNHRSVALIISETRISRRRNLPGRREASRRQCVGKLSPELCLKCFHRALIVAASPGEARQRTLRRKFYASATRRSSVSVGPTRTYDVAWARARKIARISAAEVALASWSRTLRSFKNFAIEARVRRCV